MDRNDLKAIDDYPDISFIDEYTMKRLEEEMVALFLEKRKELTGEDTVLGSADDRRIILQAGAYFLFQGYMFADDAGKMGLLKYSRGKFLENLGALKQIFRKEAVGATTTVRFSIETPRETVIGVPQGTRLTCGDGIYFATDEYGEILSGQTYVDIGATCTSTGAMGNDYEVGDLDTVVDPVPYLDSARNITKPENGMDVEDDESLRERIYMAPASYSTAGTEDSYKYYAREYNTDIGDIMVTSPSPRIVRVIYLLKDGTVPGEESIKGLEEYLSRPEIKPVTDKIEVMAPQTVSYSLDMTYYINRSDRSRAAMIQKSVETSVKEYILWQQSKMGRDINPYELIKKVMSAGAKRAEIRGPLYQVIPNECVAALEQEQVKYGGLEDD